MFEKAPTKLSDIRDQIKSISHIDDIQFIPFSESTDELLGLLVRWKQNYPYGAETYHCAVCYNENEAAWMQRLICCKEMMHIFDGPTHVTRTREDVNGLLDNLLGHVNAYSVENIFHIQAQTDRVAVLQAFGVMFPLQVLEDRKLLVEQSLKALSDIATEFSVPEAIVEFLLSPQYLNVAKDMLSTTD